MDKYRRLNHDYHHWRWIRIHVPVQLYSSVVLKVRTPSLFKIVIVIHYIVRWFVSHRPSTGSIQVRVYTAEKGLIVDSGRIYDITLLGGKVGVYNFHQSQAIWSVDRRLELFTVIDYMKIHKITDNAAKNSPSETCNESLIIENNLFYSLWAPICNVSPQTGRISQ